MAVEAVVSEIIGYIVIEGVEYLLEKFVDEVGKIIWRAFTDEDGDGEPDDYDNPFTIWDEEPEGWLPFLPKEGDDNEPTEQTFENIVLITPDGPVIMFANPDSEDYKEIAKQANEAWLSSYGATVKPFYIYTVSEALLFIIAGCVLFSFFCKLFKRRKF